MPTPEQQKELILPLLFELGFVSAYEGRRYDLHQEGYSWCIHLSPMTPLPHSERDPPYLSGFIRRMDREADWGWHINADDPLRDFTDHLRRYEFPVDAILRTKRLEALLA